jgi:hypothetical protein
MGRIDTCKCQCLAGNDELDERPAGLRTVRQCADIATYRIEPDIPKRFAAESLGSQSKMRELVPPIRAGIPSQQLKPFDGRPTDLGVIR